MNPLTPADIPPLPAFEAIRDELRARVIAHKAPRRIAVGDRVTLLFEDRETIRWQVLEMCRVEKTHDARGIAHELAVYNDLVPGPGELSATMFIEITEPGKIRPELDRLLGIDECVALRIGERDVRAQFDARQLDDDRISAVHYLRFALAPEDIARFRDPATPAALRIDHRAYQAETPLSAAARASLLVDLTGDPPPLLDFTRAAESAPRDRIVRTTPHFLVIAPAQPKTPGHVRIEARDPTNSSFLEAPVDLLAEAMALAQQCARDIEKSGGAAHILIEPTQSPLRVDVLRVA